jgi:hypothetical protein
LYAPRHSLRSCPRRDFMGSAAAERYPLGSLVLIRRMRLAIVIFILVCACGEQDASIPLATVADSLIGTWRIVGHTPPEATDTGSSLPFGTRPRGYLVYDPTGHVFFQVQRAGAADSLLNRPWRDAPDSILREVLEGFQAYYGTYALDALARSVTHRIEGEFLPRRGETELATPFHFRHDSLILGRDSLERWIFVRVR